VADRLLRVWLDLQVLVAVYGARNTITGPNISVTEPAISDKIRQDGSVKLSAASSATVSAIQMKQRIGVLVLGEIRVLLSLAPALLSFSIASSCETAPMENHYFSLLRLWRWL